MTVTSATNKADGIAAWDKTLADVNNIDENFANARDLGYSRLNRTRVSVIGRLGQYDSSDIYRIQVQSNGKLFVNIRNGDSVDSENSVANKYESQLEAIKKNLAQLGINQEEEAPEEEVPQTPLEKARAKVAQMKAEREEKNDGLLAELAPGMRLKIYKQQGKRTILIGDTQANENSKEYANIKSILEGTYRAKKGNYYLEVSSTDGVIGEDKPYVMQIRQGKKYTDDYLVKETYSEDSINKTISLTSSTSSSDQISSSYAAQLQAQQYAATATMLANAYSNLSSVLSKSSKANNLISSLLNLSI